MRNSLRMYVRGATRYAYSWHILFSTIYSLRLCAFAITDKRRSIIQRIINMFDSLPSSSRQIQATALSLSKIGENKSKIIIFLSYIFI